MSVKINFLTVQLCLSLLLTGCATSVAQIKKPILAPESTDRWRVYLDVNYKPFANKFFSGTIYDGKCPPNVRGGIKNKASVSESFEGSIIWDPHYFSKFGFDFDCIGVYYELAQIERSAESGDEFSAGYMYLYRLFEYEEHICDKVAHYTKLDVGNVSKKIDDDLYLINGYVAESCGDEASAVRWYNLAANEGNRDAYHAINFLWARQAERQQAKILRRF